MISQNTAISIITAFKPLWEVTLRNVRRFVTTPHLEDGGNELIRNLWIFPPDYTTSHFQSRLQNHACVFIHNGKTERANELKK
jgi:hypothetical protein